MGKAHQVVIPYVDENGIPQEPRFGVSSFGGKKIRELSSKLYELVVQTKKTGQKSQGISQRNMGPQYEGDPLNILKIRYAKGEISKDEYEQMKKDLLS